MFKVWTRLESPRQPRNCPCRKPYIPLRPYSSLVTCRTSRVKGTETVREQRSQLRWRGSAGSAATSHPLCPGCWQPQELLWPSWPLSPGRTGISAHTSLDSPSAHPGGAPRRQQQSQSTCTEVSGAWTSRSLKAGAALWKKAQNAGVAKTTTKTGCWPHREWRPKSGALEEGPLPAL